MKERAKQADANFEQAFAQIAADSRWHDEFAGAPCVFAHMITFNAHRRLQALNALGQSRVAPKGYGDPVEYERAHLTLPAE